MWLRILLDHWSQRFVETARANAGAGCAALTQCRLEREEVAAYVADRLSARDQRVVPRAVTQR